MDAAGQKQTARAPTFDAEAKDFSDALARLGVRKGDTILVHSSYKSPGHAGNPPRRSGALVQQAHRRLGPPLPDTPEWGGHLSLNVLVGVVASPP